LNFNEKRFSVILYSHGTVSSKLKNLYWTIIKNKWPTKKRQKVKQ